MTVKKTSDFPVHFSYKADEADGIAGTSIADIHITGINSAIANLTEQEIANTTVKLAVQLSSSGLLDIASAQLILPEVNEGSSVTDKIKGFFGGSKDKKDDENATESGEEKTEAAAEEPVKKQSGPVRLGVQYVGTPFEAMPAAHKKDAIKR